MGEGVHHDPIWDFVSAPARPAPGISSMVGYRALEAPEGLHRGLPSSRLTFIIALDDGVEATSTAAALRHARPHPVIIGGLHTAASYVRQRATQAGVQIAMHPLAARSVLGLPAAELPVTDFDGESVLGRWPLELHEQLREATAWDTRFHLVAERLIRRHCDRDVLLRPELLHAWDLLERSDGRIPVAELATAVGLSTRHLGTLFHQELGRSPKQVAGLMRFENSSISIARQVRRRGRADLARVAADAGFSDQAHLTREFTRYAGLGPSSWIREEFRNIQDGGHGAVENEQHD